MRANNSQLQIRLGRQDAPCLASQPLRSASAKRDAASSAAPRRKQAPAFYCAFYIPFRSYIFSRGVGVDSVSSVRCEVVRAVK